MMGMNPRKMQQMMKKMGIQQQDIQAEEVIIRTAEKEIVITECQVAKVNMMGQENFQISGNVSEREISTMPELSDEDIKTVMDQAGVTLEKAKEALEKSNGDIAAAILELS